MWGKAAIDSCLTVPIDPNRTRRPAPPAIYQPLPRLMRRPASALFGSPEWRASATKRIIAGKAPHLEAHCMQVLLPKTDKREHQVLVPKVVIHEHVTVANWRAARELVRYALRHLSGPLCGSIEAVVAGVYSVITPVAFASSRATSVSGGALPQKEASSPQSCARVRFRTNVTSQACRTTFRSGEKAGLIARANFVFPSVAAE